MIKLALALLVGSALLWDCLGFPALQRFRLEERWPSPDFSKVDFSSIEAETQARLPGEDAESVSELVRRNFQYVFFNRLNRDRFLVPPRPQDVAQRVLALLRLNRELGLSIESCKSYLGRDQEGKFVTERRLIRQIEDTAKRLHDQFGEFFLETREATYSFRIPKSNRDTRFLHFVRQADQINRRLTQEMDAYFLAKSPGAIHLADYGKVTISVLTESLTRLCKISLQGL